MRRGLRCEVGGERSWWDGSLTCECQLCLYCLMGVCVSSARRTWWCARCRGSLQPGSPSTSRPVVRPFTGSRSPQLWVARSVLLCSHSTLFGQSASYERPPRPRHRACPRPRRPHLARLALFALELEGCGLRAWRTEGIQIALDGREA